MDIAETRNGGISKLTELLIRYRWIFVVPVLLPLSTLFKLILGVHNFYHRVLRNAPERHDQRVRDIQKHIQNWRANGSKGKLCTARKNWMRISARTVDYKHPENTIPIDLYGILKVDTERKIVRVEPRVTIGQLIDHLVPRGWTLPVVPEVDDLTVSGLFLGYGIEVSSHIYGLFSELVRSCDVILGDGRLVRASPTENVELFNALPWSQGSLGFIVALELTIIPAKQYVHVTYRPVKGFDEMCAILEKESHRDEPPDFIEAILFDRTEGIYITGTLTDKAEFAKVFHANRWYVPWYAARSRKFIQSGGHQEFIPLSHFYRRHHRSMYWESELIVPFGDHPLFRFLLGWMMPPKVAFLRLTQGERIKRYYDEKHVLQDALVPMCHARKALGYFDQIFDAYPIWLCPFRINKKEPRGFSGPSDDAGDYEMYVDIAVLAVPGPVMRGEDYNALEATRRMERFLIEHRGYQALYAVTQMCREEFEHMFDCTLYRRVRRDYAADDSLMDAYDKVRLPHSEITPHTNP